MYSISLLRRISERGMKPATASRHSGCAKKISYAKQRQSKRSADNEGFDQAEATPWSAGRSEHPSP